MHEIFCMHVGQCGLQLGFALWELLSAEHNINRDGKSNGGNIEENDSYQAFFNLSRSGQYVPRGIFVDLEPSVIDQMKTGSFALLYHPDQLISGSEDAANNFARGYHTVGRIMRHTCENRIRKEFEVANRIQGIHVYRSLGGGTGSGMTATIFEILIEYAKLSKIEIPIHPSPHLSCAVVEPYNCILSEHFCMEDIDISFLIDNEALYDIAMNHVDLKEPTFHNINRLVAQVCSSVTASARFENELCNDFTSLTNLVPYPRIHFPLVSFSPFGSEAKVSKDVNSIADLTHELFHADNQLVKCDPASGKNMACSIVYRGNISPTEVYSTLSDIKCNRLVRFVDWCPTGFKVGIVKQPPQVLPQSMLGNTDKSAVMMTNNSAVSAVWHRLAQKFHRLYAKRSFIHWFVAEGLEESEFCESLYNLATLAKDYEEVALDTVIEPNKRETPAGGEGENAGEATAVAEGESAKKSGASSHTGQDDNDDDEDDNENASNASDLKNKVSNNNKSLNWCNQFEALIKSLYETEELATSKLKYNMLSNGEATSPCNELCIEKNKEEFKAMFESYTACSKSDFLKAEIEHKNVDPAFNENVNNQLNFKHVVKNFKELQAKFCKNKQFLSTTNGIIYNSCQENTTSGSSIISVSNETTYCRDTEEVSNLSFSVEDIVNDESEMGFVMDQLVRITSLQ